MTDTDREETTSESGFWKLLGTTFEALGFLVQTLWMSAEDMWDWLKRKGDREMRHLRAGLILLIAAPSMLAVLALALGFTGHAGGYLFGDIFLFQASFGHKVELWNQMILRSGYLMLAAAICFLVVGIYLWVRFAFWTELLMLAGTALAKVPIPWLKMPRGYVHRKEGETAVFNEIFSDGLTPALVANHLDTAPSEEAKESARRFLRGLIGLVYWGTVASVYALVFPVYASPLAFGAALLAGAGIFLATYRFQIDSPWTKRISLAFLTIVIIVVTINIPQILMVQARRTTEIRHQRAYAEVYEGLGIKQQSLLKTQGPLAKRSPAYRELEEQKELIEQEMTPTTPAGIAKRLWLRMGQAYAWSEVKLEELDERFEEEDEAKAVQSSEPDPALADGMPDYFKQSGSGSSGSEPSEPSGLTDEDRAKLRAFLKGMEEDSEKTKEILAKNKELRKKLEDIEF